MSNDLGIKQMNTTNAHVRGSSKRTFARTHQARTHQGLAVLLALLCGLTLTGIASAQQALENVSYQVLPGGTVQLNLQFDGPAPAPSKVFTTAEPPQIALDFAGVENTVSKRNIDIGTGSTSGITLASAGGRTRMVIDLFRPSSYSTSIVGDTLHITVANGMSSGEVVAYAATDPTKVSANTGPSITGIDFRRGTNGAGRVVVDFSTTGANANLHREGDRVVVDLDRVQVPEQLVQHLDVMDFATPVKFIETRDVRGGAQLNIAAVGDFEVSAYQTGTQYVVEVAPPAEVKADKPEIKLGPDGRPLPVYTGERVTFNFQDIPVRQLLHLIAGLSNLNIVIADSVGGQITLRLINVPWDQALDVVLRAKGLDKRKSGNVVWIAPQEEIAKREQKIAEARAAQEQHAELIADYIPISYGKAEDIAKLLTEGGGAGGGAAGAGGANADRGFLSARGSVTFDQRTNTLLVNDTPEKIREIRALVATLDKPVEQVLIESRIVVATDNFTRELGVRFGLTGGYEDSDGNVVTTSGSLFAADNMAQNALVNRFNNNGSGLPVIGGDAGVPALGDRLNINLPSTLTGTSGFGIAILGADYLLDLELSAAQSEGKSEIISSPRVVTANQQPAVIKQGQQIGYVTYQSSGGGGGGQANVQFKDAVLELKVTPTITADRRVFLDLNVKKDTLADLVPSPGGGFVPQIDTREVSTSVLVDNGQTVVLGGIYEFEKREDVTKVPFLGDIPWLGALFRNKQTSNNRAELLIFVTPRILSEDLN